MANVNLPVRLAPEFLDQPILPNWQFNLFGVDLGGSTNPDIEKAAIEKIGSYGKQIGHLAEALEIVIKTLGLVGEAVPPTSEDKDKIHIFMADVATARTLKSKPCR